MLIEHLQKVFAERCRKNPSYSLRSFARSLDIDSSTLSALLRGKRPLTAKTAKHLVDALDIRDQDQAKELLLGVIGAQRPAPAYQELALDAAEVISSWEHFALLACLEIEGFRGSSRSLAKRLNIPLGIVLECLQRLKNLGLVKESGEAWVLTGRNMATPSNVPNTALREALRQNIRKSLEALDQVQVPRRDITGITFAACSSLLPEARRMIQEFRYNLAHFLESGPKDSVFRLNVQLFPLSEEK